MKNLKPLWIKESLSPEMPPRIAEMGYNAVVLNAPCKNLSGLQSISTHKELNPDYLLVHAKFLENQKLHLTLEDLMRAEIDSLLSVKNKIIYLIPDLPPTQLHPWLLPLEKELPSRFILVGGSIPFIEHGKVLPFPSKLEGKRALFSSSPRFPQEDEMLAASLFIGAHVQDGEKSCLELFSKWCESYRPDWLKNLPLFLRLQRHMEDKSLYEEPSDSLRKLLTAETNYLSSCLIKEIEEVFSEPLNSV
ncbi:MAG: hypothetical protein WD595_01385 [Waddliaceae bacterium]